MDGPAILQDAIRLQQQRDWSGARRLYEKLLKDDRDHFVALANLASVLAHLGEIPLAKRCYRRALEQDGSMAALWFNYANLCHKTGDLDKAEGAFRKALDLDEAMAPAWFNLGNLLRETECLDESERCFRRAISLNPGIARVHMNLGNLLRSRGRTEEAVKAHEAALALDADDPDILLNLGNALTDLRRFPEADEQFQAGLRRNAQHVKLLKAVAQLRTLQGRFEDGVGYYRQLLAIRPDDEAVHLNLGKVLFQLKQNESAVAHLREAARLGPNKADILAQLGFTLAELGQLSEARQIAGRLVESHPEVPASWMLHGFTAVQRSEIAVGLGDFAKIRELDPGAGVGISNTCFASLYADFLTPEQVTELHLSLSGKVMDVIDPASLHPRGDWTARRVRVGYLSPDFRGHPVGYFLEPILSNHDHQEFEIFGYGLQARVEDETGAKLVSDLDHWLLCHEWDDAQLIERIRDDELDILVDLGGYTANCKMPLLASRLAPVQALYLGYPCTSGLPAMDFIIGDERLIPDSAEALYSETPARLPASFLCFQPRPGTPEVAELPAKRKAYITFGSFNNLPKLSDRCVALWARVLEAVPRSRLLLKALSLKDGGTREHVWRRFEKAGVPRARLELHGPTVPITAFLAEYGRIDIALDTAPYNGGTTTCDALWMGVPVLTRAGRHFYERMGSSILNTLGHGEWVADDDERYLETALELASDLDELAGLRQALRTEMRSSALCDAPRFTRGLEDLYRSMLARTGPVAASIPERIGR